ncbi:MAG: hypothetical protein QM535_06670 [Limnohabitans sp.]|nr:hypothetical protein [Limnohabitans sp.]
MFVKFIKEISLKKILKNRLKNVTPNVLETPIKKIGVLIDENYFFDKEKLVREIVNNGLKKENITILSYKSKINKNDTITNPTFSDKDMSWKGDFVSQDVTSFMKTPFDLLISYYDIEKASLLLITNGSKALFKVGFSTIDRRLNHLMINTNAENYKVFVHELFRYLKILNKI